MEEAQSEVETEKKRKKVETEKKRKKVETEKKRKKVESLYGLLDWNGGSSDLDCWLLMIKIHVKII